jgi:16S rRNA (guanine527-N7)-methyltransferase
MKDILRYFPNISAKQKSQFQQLESLYTEWNEQINLISRKEIDLLYTRHILHSLAIAKFIQFKPGSSVMDVGTGGGFPGIPLAIMFPETNFYLIDSIAKKIMVVNDIIEQLKLNNCKGEQIRAEKVKEKFDFIVSRAVTQFPKFYTWVRNNIAKPAKNNIPNGIIYLKGGNLNEELSDFNNWYTSKNISNYFDDPFFETKKIIHVFRPSNY